MINFLIVFNFSSWDVYKLDSSSRNSVSSFCIHVYLIEFGNYNLNCVYRIRLQLYLFRPCESPFISVITWDRAEIYQKEMGSFWICDWDYGATGTFVSLLLVRLTHLLSLGYISVPAWMTCCSLEIEEGNTKWFIIRVFILQ